MKIKENNNDNNRHNLQYNSNRKKLQNKLETETLFTLYAQNSSDLLVDNIWVYTPDGSSKTNKDI